MSKSKRYADEREATQVTPKGAEIPIPKRKDFFGELKKVAKAGGEGNVRAVSRPEKRSAESVPEDNDHNR